MRLASVSRHCASNLLQVVEKQKKNHRESARRGHGELLRHWSPLGVSEHFVGGWERLYKAFHGSWYIAVAFTCCFIRVPKLFPLCNVSEASFFRSRPAAIVFAFRVPRLPFQAYDRTSIERIYIVRIVRRIFLVKLRGGKREDSWGKSRRVDREKKKKNIFCLYL